MTEGFTVDATYGGTAVSSWMEGAPRKSMWTGLKLTGMLRSEIATWRCNRCGFLEHYATDTPNRKYEMAQRKQALLVVAVSLAILLVVLGTVLIAR
jgi:hypothetical protein